MSHVSALPRTPSASVLESVLEESAVEATQFALATLESFPSVFENMDAGDAAVVTLGAAVVARTAYSVLVGGTIGSQGIQGTQGIRWFQWTQWFRWFRWTRWLPGVSAKQ